MAVSAGGREARTHYTVLERYATATLLECKLETGRTHQIRVHLAAIGHPIAGDARYRGPKVAGLGRPFLHAYKLAFDHPVTGERLAFSSELPGDLEVATREARGGR
jgi:23S rRNA pseudouridine1911/1915/1917 synthase